VIFFKGSKALGLQASYYSSADTLAAEATPSQSQVG
jgi:hypothetical protein